MPKISERNFKTLFKGRRSSKLGQMRKQPLFLARDAQHYKDVSSPTIIYKSNVIPKKYQQDYFYGDRQVDNEGHMEKQPCKNY